MVREGCQYYKGKGVIVRFVKNVVALVLCTALVVGGGGVASASCTDSCSENHVHSTLIETSDHVKTRSALEQLVDEALKDLPQDCSSEMMTAAVKEVLPNAVVISAAEAREIETIDDVGNLLSEDGKVMLYSMTYEAKADLLDMLYSVARDDDAYLIVDVQPDGIIGVIISFCIMCLQMTSHAVVLTGNKYVDTAIMWLVEHVLISHVCKVCGWDEISDEQVYLVEPVPLCSCGNYATWRGYWYCTRCQAAF